MTAPGARSIVDRLLSICLSLLVGATAIYVAVRLVEAVAAALLVILGIGTFVLAAVLLVRRHNRDW
ncbi:hypothetical protein SAMN05444157_0713 [Frankineae bacterium MT45]|nr:hypothetical protein SAMN05444157_0713 [Frankineae bacterium MT45]